MDISLFLKVTRKNFSLCGYANNSKFLIAKYDNLSIRKNDECNGITKH
jgi:hypothetical protein